MFYLYDIAVPDVLQQDRRVKNVQKTKAIGVSNALPKVSLI